MKVDFRVVSLGFVLTAIVFFFARSGPSHDLASRLLAEDPAVAEAARHELLQAEPQHLEVLRGMLREDVRDWQGEATVLAALDVVSEIAGGATAAVPELIKLTESNVPHVRDLAARTLPSIGATAEQAVPALTAALQPDPSVPVLRALSEYKAAAEPAVSEMIEIMKNQDLTAEVRWNAARTIGKAREGGAAAIPELVAHLKDKERTVREHAAEALGDIGPLAQSTAPDLIAVLDDEYVKVRRDAVRSLGQINADPTTTIPAIKHLLEDPEEIVRDATQVTLDTLMTAQKEMGEQDEAVE